MADVFGVFQLYPRCEHTAARAGSDNGGAGRLADAPRGLEVRWDVLRRITRRSGPCREAMRQTAHRREISGNVHVDSYMEASPWRCGSDLADPQRPPLQPRPGHA